MTKQRIKNISCVMIAKDAQATIKSVLDSLIEFDDVVVYSNNSTDKTDEIAKTYTNANLIQGEFLGFGPTKNRAATFAKNDWILSLDADEVLSQEFVTNLKTTKLDEKSLYTILRTNYYKTTQIKHCWGNDIITRVYNRSKTSFTDKKVHEKIIEDGFKIESINGAIKHYPYSNITDFIVKLDRYSTIFANDNVGKKSSSPLKAFLNGGFSFFKTYFLKGGFLDGYPGLVIAFSHMATNFYKYIKLYELNRELKQ
ncbi:glycosyltransferase family 2 protein [Candidatus Sulfurimonas baltica]|uniref:Glycosyltransferase family 2 protein n=1 Tax=Candidatus Sulfurimonas baltica TaxID=2740404 RepID=A0A7S7LU77_9BACT|nr:glycosyltransferase family 2 protein [Candidatus Sulfurimonas baltica]QOY51427.1 glycosyltransferase family 2 protein [Candidatus Sulfurimonas baltica]